jgi:hypothetical protein
MDDRSDPGRPPRSQPGSDDDIDSDAHAGGVEDEPDAADDLDARELARIRRRDHDAEVEQRALMRAGMGKVFKQITDSWGEKASRDRKHARKATRRDA